MTATVHTLHKEWEDKSPEELSELLKDKMGRFRSKSLFVETAHPDYPSIFTLKPYDHKGHISLYRKYMEIADPTEYEVARQCLGSWKHWKNLTNAGWFKAYLDEWRKELDNRIKAESAKIAQELAKSSKSDATRFQAAKWLADRGYDPEPKTKTTKQKRGRPSNDEVMGELRKELEKHKDLSEDWDRLGLGD